MQKRKSDTAHPTRAQMVQLQDKIHADVTETHQLFCIRDADANGYGLPQAALNAAMFIREMEMVFKNPDHPITKYAHRFEIYQCGGFDYRHGMILPGELRFVGLVSDFKPKVAPPEPIVNR